MRRLLRYFGSMMTGGVIAMLAIVYIQKTAPIISDMRPVEWVLQKKSIQAKIVGHKNRPDCHPVENSMIGYVKHNGVWEEVPFKFLKDKNFNSRPAEYQSFGWWDWNARAYEPTHVLMRMAHICNGNAKLQYTDIGPWQVPVK